MGTLEWVPIKVPLRLQLPGVLSGVEEPIGRLKTGFRVCWGSPQGHVGIRASHPSSTLAFVLNPKL